jgi:hypothetical protein
VIVTSGDVVDSDAAVSLFDVHELNRFAGRGFENALFESAFVAGHRTGSRVSKDGLADRTKPDQPDQTGTLYCSKYRARLYQQIEISAGRGSDPVSSPAAATQIPVCMNMPLTA